MGPEKNILRSSWDKNDLEKNVNKLFFFSLFGPNALHQNES